MSISRVQRILSEMSSDGANCPDNASQGDCSDFRRLQASNNLGLTIRFTELIPKTSGEGTMGDWLRRRGNFYLITSVLDGSGKIWDHHTKLFHGIKAMEPFPLGEGGLLVAFLKNPKWFVDIHTLVMESDADARDFSASYAQAQKDSGLLSAVDALASMVFFNPSSVLNVIQTVEVFLKLLIKQLSKNGDDVVASLHDCWLAQQQFGSGRHPKHGFRHYNRMKAAYKVDVFSLNGVV